MHHFVYETTNLINNKKYIGKRSTDKIEDRYLGSGKALLRDVKKYGKENFVRKILIIANNEEDAYWYENKLVTKETVNDNMYYNKMTGGCGVSSSMWENAKYKERMISSVKEKWKDDKFKNKMSEFMKSQWKNPKFRNRMKELWKDENFLDMQREKMKQQWENPESRKILRDAIVNRWKNPEYKEKMKKKRDEYINDPKYREKLSKRKEGENNTASKLTEINVRDIKRRLKIGESGVSISKLYKISTATISAINIGRLWKHVKI